MSTKFEISQVAESTPFDNDTNLFTADNVQDAIEETSVTAGNPIYPITLQHNGTVSNGTFFGYSNLIPGDDTPVIVPVDSNFLSFSFSNKSSNADYTLNFRKGSTTSAVFLSVSKTNTKFFVHTLATIEPFSGGDSVFVEYDDDGSNASDVGLVLYFKAT